MAKIRDRHGKFSDLRPRKPVQISSHVIQWLRETYVEMPGSQIGGLCERLRPSLPWKIGYEIIAGIERPWLKDLVRDLSLIHISEPTRLLSISYAVFCLK